MEIDPWTKSAVTICIVVWRLRSTQMKSEIRRAAVIQIAYFSQWYMVDGEESSRTSELMQNPAPDVTSAQTKTAMEEIRRRWQTLWMHGRSAIGGGSACGNDSDQGNVGARASAIVSCNEHKNEHEVTCERTNVCAYEKAYCFHYGREYSHKHVDGQQPLAAVVLDDQSSMSSSTGLTYCRLCKTHMSWGCDEMPTRSADRDSCWQQVVMKDWRWIKCKGRRPGKGLVCHNVIWETMR